MKTSYHLVLLKCMSRAITEDDAMCFVNMLHHWFVQVFCD